MRSWLHFAPILLALAACSTPAPPKITPRSAKLAAISPTGIDITAELDAENPNDIALSARSVTAKVTLDGRYDVGTVKVDTPLELPPHKKVPISAPLSLRWSDVAALGALAATSQNIPYTVDGTVELGGSTLHVNLPFELTGTITHAQLVQAALGAIPKGLIPGLNVAPPH